MKIKDAVLAVALLVAFVPQSEAAGEGSKATVLQRKAPHAVSEKEKEVLQKYFKWKKSDSFPKAYTYEELYAVMDACNDNTLELEDYDWQQRKVVVALMVLGDKAFAKELDGRAVPVQKEVVAMLKPLWEKYRLSYPEVQALAAVLKNLKD